MPLVRYDPTRKVRLDLNQPALQKAATELLKEIIAHLQDEPSEAAKYKPLVDYARKALAGEIDEPRSWDIDPLKDDFRAGELPLDIEDAYGTFAFYAHGLTIDDNPPVTTKDGVSYIELDA